MARTTRTSTTTRSRAKRAPERVESSAYLTPLEAADLLRVHRQVIYRAIAAGELAHVRIGRNIRIPRTALENDGDARTA